MFRQIRVYPDDHDLQRILWSMRTLAQLALDQRTHFPLCETYHQENTTPLPVTMNFWLQNLKKTN